MLPDDYFKSVGILVPEEGETGGKSEAVVVVINWWKNQYYYFEDKGIKMNVFFFNI